MALHSKEINIMSVCSGIGGLDIGVSRALEKLGFDPITELYVERESYAAAVLVKEMEKERLDEAGIWSDLSTLDGSRYKGTDIIIGGIPCQPYSLAGKGLAQEDPRDLWPEMFRLLKETGATAIFLENVQGFVRRRLRLVLEDLSSIGFNAEWGCFSAQEVGAPHIRKRLFLLAYTDCSKLRKQQRRRSGEEGKDESFPGVNGSKEFMAHSNGERKLQQKRDKRTERRRPGRRCEKDFLTDTDFSWLKEKWWTTEPKVGRMAHGIPNRLDRLRSLGNAVVPQCAERAFIELFNREMESM